MRCTAGKETPLGITGGHDWVLVRRGELAETLGPAKAKLLWACPCSEFKWTSYAEWEAREAQPKPEFIEVGDGLWKQKP